MKFFYPLTIFILFALVGYLFYKSNKKNVILPANNTKLISTGNNLPMAYFDIDSINENYTYCKVVKAKLEKMKDDMDNELSKLQANLETTQNDYQRKNSQKPLTPQEQELAMASLQKMQQNIANKREAFVTEFENARKKSETTLKAAIQSFIKKYNTPQQYSYIVADEPGVFFYKDTFYNITGTLLAGLNDAYK